MHRKVFGRLLKYIKLGAWLVNLANISTYLEKKEENFADEVAKLMGMLS